MSRLAGVGARQGVDHGGSTIAPPLDDGLVALGPADLDAAECPLVDRRDVGLVDDNLAAIDHFGGKHLGVGEVADRIEDGPAGRGRWQLPVAFVHSLQKLVEGLLLGNQVGKDLTHTKPF